LEVLQLNSEPILKPANQGQFLTQTYPVGGVGRVTHLCQWLLDNHDVRKVVTILAIDLHGLEIGIFHYTDKVIQLVEVLLEIGCVVTHPLIN
jgi:hypothetical protein